MALISKSDLEARLGRTLTAEETTAFTLVNSALQSSIEKMIDSGVEATDVTTRYYDGGVQTLSISPCTGITAVKYVDDDSDVDYTFLDNEYSKEPINSTLKTYLRNRWGAFRTGINNITVTAKFSIFDDTNTLNIVKNAMLEALESEVTNSDNILKESIEGYSIEYASAETKSALNSIKLLFPGI